MLQEINDVWKAATLDISHGIKCACEAIYHTPKPTCSGEKMFTVLIK